MRFPVISVLLAGALMAAFGDIRTRQTNIKCVTRDPSYAKALVCRLNVLGRGIIGANVHVKLLKLPVRKVSINFSIFQKLSGYHPFLFNVTADLCHYMKHPNPLNVFYYFYGAMLPFINVNHTCPINHDVILKDFVLDDQMFAKVPLPKGSYMFEIKIISEGVWRGTIYSYLDINVDDNPRIKSG
ncbi:uncharacterized protein [Drosophila pseudoobscura]|uniref:MD-2-related lipid-recognition domain-containing protein n=1 Tax=Drosophila pseudoobscura pseudoobscura TaxID=46245 RepID=A0A6I8V5W1_DROPS|nr:uncharacterized protein LOC6898696 [Drosophila pseudoobscura]